MKRRREIVVVSMGPANKDYEFEATFMDTPLRVRRFGCDSRLKKAHFLVQDLDGQVDVITLGGMSIYFHVGGKRWVHREAQALAREAKYTPVVGGRRLKSIIEKFAVRELARQFPELLPHETVLFMSGINNYEMSQVMSEYTMNLAYADPVLHFSVPYILDSAASLDLYARFFMPYLTRLPYSSFYPQGEERPWRDRLIEEAFRQAELIIGDHIVLRAYIPRQIMDGKVIVSNILSDADLKEMKEHGARMAIATAPPLFGRPVTTNVMEAMLLAVLGKWEVSEDDCIQMIEQEKIRPQIYHLQEGKYIAKRKFAFLLQPLKQEDLFQHPLTQPVKVLPPLIRRNLERVASRIPPHRASWLTGIKSEATGVEAEGWLIAIGSTPRELARHGPENAYNKVVEASKLAARLGARVLGLGAFSKVLGAAGGTIARRSWLPITTGDSYAASLALWAVNEACTRMGIPRDAKGRIQGRAMIVGAADPTGTVAALLLPLIVPELILADLAPDRLLELRAQILEGDRPCRVMTTTNPHHELGQADVVVMVDFQRFHFTIKDIELFKPGAIVCDTSEPPAIPSQITHQRPDLMVVRAGLVELPGTVRYSRDIGLEPKTAHASMAEAAILALEGRFEPFSQGSNINIEQVREIYRLGLKHGFKLAAIRGPQGVYTDSQIALIRQYARERGAKLAAEPGG